MSMKSRKTIPMETHREMGRRIKRAEHAILDVLSFSCNYYAGENDKLFRALKNLGHLKSRLEDEMFSDHPLLDNSIGFAVYYGDLEGGDDDGNNASGDSRC